MFQEAADDYSRGSNCQPGGDSPRRYENIEKAGPPYPPGAGAWRDPPGGPCPAAQPGARDGGGRCPASQGGGNFIPGYAPGDGMAGGWENAKSSIDEVFEYVPWTHATDPESCRAIYHLIRRFQPRSVLEIGTNRGASTLYAAMAMREYRNAGRPPRLVTVDLFDVNDPATAEAKRYRISTPPREMLARLDVPAWSSSPSPGHGLSERARNGVRFHPPGPRPGRGHRLPGHRAGNQGAAPGRTSVDSFLLSGREPPGDG